MATIIKVDGSKVKVKPAGANGKLTLEQLQAAVGGYIEHLSLPKGGSMFIDEEGKLKGKQYNFEATELVRGIIGDDDDIVGDAIVCGEKEIE